MTNKHKHIRKCDIDDRIFYGYKGRQFFESDNAYKGFALEKAGLVIKRITDLVEIKNQLNLLASLIHEFLQPVSIIMMCEGLDCIPVDWEDEHAIYTGQLIDMPIEKKERKKRARPGSKLSSLTVRSDVQS